MTLDIVVYGKKFRARPDPSCGVKKIFSIASLFSLALSFSLSLFPSLSGPRQVIFHNFMMMPLLIVRARDL